MSNQSNNSLCCVPFENIFSDIVCWFELIHSGLIVRKKEQKTKEDLLHLFHDGAFARFSGPWNILKVIQRSHLTLKLKVKYRESFRPFAPSVLREDVSEWFDIHTYGLDILQNGWISILMVWIYFTMIGYPY